MTCKQVGVLLSSYVDMELPGGDMCLVRAHLMHCPNCAAEEQWLRGLKTTMACAPMVEPSCDFEIRLRQRLQFIEPAEQRKPSRAWLIAGIGFAAAASVYFVSTRSVPAPAPKTIHSLASEIRNDQVTYASADPLSGGRWLFPPRMPANLVALCLGLCPAPPEDRAVELLSKCMSRTFTVNVRAVMLQRSPDGDGVRQVKIEQSKSGKSRITVIAPIADQGVEFVDDGNQTVAYFPDSKKLVFHSSHRRKEANTRKLVQLAASNYVIDSEESGAVAGRPVTVVIARPRSAELPIRRFSIDSETGYLLRLTVSQPGAKAVLYFDTLSVSYPQKIEEPTTDIRVPDAKVIREEKPKYPWVGADLGQTRYLPMGFIVRGQERLCDEADTIAVRITDGLVRGTIYQWKRQGEEKPQHPPRNSSSADLGNFRVMIVADVTPAARDRFLDWMREFGPFEPKPDPKSQSVPRYGTFRSSKPVPHN